MSATMKNYRLTRYIKEDGSYDIQEDVCYVGKNKVPQASFFYPGAKITYQCDDHPGPDMAVDSSGRPTCSVCQRQPEE